jgi:hypothetical protein
MGGPVASQFCLVGAFVIILEAPFRLEACMLWL